MKRLFLVFFAVASLFFGCRNDADDSQNEVQLSLKQRIATAESGAEIDLEKENLLIRKNTSYIVSSPMTIKNGDTKNARFIVKSPGVVFENLKRVKTVIVDESVGEDDFYLKNCDSVEELFVKGGGEAIYIDSTEILKLVVKKIGVHIIFRGSVAIKKAFIFSDCKLSSENSGITIEEIIISETVKNLELGGELKIGRIVSKDGSNITIIVDVNVTIVAADSNIQDSIKNNPENSDYNNKAEEIEEDELTEDDKKDIEEVENDLKELELSDSDFYLWCLDEKTGFYNKSNNSSVFSLLKTDSENIFYNKNPKTIDKAWDYFLEFNSYPNIKAGKNYKISFDLKSDKESYVCLQIKDEKTYSCTGSTTLCDVSTEYKTFSVETGSSVYDWYESKILLSCGSVSSLYIKNFTIEEISDVTNIVTQIHLNDPKGNINDVAVNCDNSSVKIKFNKEFVDDYDFNGVNGVNLVLIDKPLSVGKLYKVSFDVTSDISLSEGSDSSGDGDFGFWLHSTVSNHDDASGSNYFGLEADTPRTINVYLPSYQLHDESIRISRIWISSKRVCTITVDNISVTETSLNEILAENQDYGLNFKAGIDGYWQKTPIERSVAIPAGKTAIGQLILTDNDSDWTSTKYVTTSFRFLSENVISSINAQRSSISDDTYFVNTTDETVFVKFSLDDKFKMCVTQGSAEDCEGMFGDTAYLRIKPEEEGEDIFYLDFDSKNVTDDETEKWYKATYNIEYCKVRDKTIEPHYAMIKKCTFLEDKTSEYEGYYHVLSSSDIKESDEPQVITQILYLPKQERFGKFLFYSQFRGYNEVVKISDFSIEETTDSSSWYYYDIDKSDLPGDSFNIIFNNGYETQTVDIADLTVNQPVYWYDFFEPKFDDSGRYYCVQSARSDNPKETPAEGFVRIYFYSKLGDSEPPYLHYWYKTETGSKGFSTVWPGKMMIKY